jgi:hypothetical protein
VRRVDELGGAVAQTREQLGQGTGAEDGGDRSQRVGPTAALEAFDVRVQHARAAQRLPHGGGGIGRRLGKHGRGRDGGGNGRAAKAGRVVDRGIGASPGRRVLLLDQARPLPLEHDPLRCHLSLLFLRGEALAAFPSEQPFDGAFLIGAGCCDREPRTPKPLEHRVAHHERLLRALHHRTVTAARATEIQAGETRKGLTERATCSG